LKRENTGKWITSFSHVIAGIANTVKSGMANFIDLFFTPFGLFWLSYVLNKQIVRQIQLANKSIQNKLDHKFQKRVESLKLARRPLKKLIDDLEVRRCQENRQILTKLRHLYSIISGKNLLSHQFDFLDKHTEFLESLTSLTMPNAQKNEKKREEIRLKRIKLMKLKAKRDYFTTCKCGSKFGKVNFSIQ